MLLDYGHPEDHSHPSNATFIYHDYYERTNEGDIVELCARLNQPLDEQLIVHYSTESETAEVYQGIIIHYNRHKFLYCRQQLPMSSVLNVSLISCYE